MGLVLKPVRITQYDCDTGDTRDIGTLLWKPLRLTTRLPSQVTTQYKQNKERCKRIDDLLVNARRRQLRELTVELLVSLMIWLPWTTYSIPL